jgi:hypothetical protein
MNTDAPITPSLAVEMWKNLRKQRDGTPCIEWGTPDEMRLYDVLTKSLTLQAHLSGIKELQIQQNNQ